MRLFATILDRPVTLYAGAAKGPAFGAARLARLAATGEPVGRGVRKPEVAAVLEPERRWWTPTASAGSDSGRSIERCGRSLRQAPLD